MRIVNFNKRVAFDYNIDHRIECGIVLKGTETKSARLQGCSIQEASCSIQGNTIYIYNMNIPTYKKCFVGNHEPTRIRSLMIHKQQCKKLIGLINRNQWQIVPEKVYFNDKNILKVLVAVGKHTTMDYKRAMIKARESLRVVKQIKEEYKT